MSTTATNLIASDVVRVSQDAPGLLRVVFDNPPLNLFDPEIFAGLNLLRDYASERSHGVKVIVFESANPDFFFAHIDFPRIPDVSSAPGGASLIEGWPEYSRWLSSAPIVTISKIRGRARGIGNEFLVATDMRFASRERAIFSQIEVGFGMVPGGGGIEWLPRHVGRSRALEIILGADDIDGATAELYGLVNRALPDDQLDAFVDNLALRIASYPAAGVASAKELVVKRFPIPTAGELAESFGTILRLSQTDDSKAVSARVRGAAGGSLAPAELDLPAWYGPENDK